MHQSTPYDTSPAGTTIPYGYERIYTDIEQYAKDNLKTIDFGLMIRRRNIFYVLYMKDKVTSQWGFSIMLGNKTVLDIQREGHA